jgi:uncharacterized membrane protein YeaQ/YmgE (transglycosylase-associated protein family)
VNIQGFFLLYFGLFAACIAHQFVSVGDVVPEFVAKWIAGAAGAWIGPLALGHWGFAEEGVWFLPELAGALVVSFLVAVLWRAGANARRGQARAAAPDVSSVQSAAPLKN